MKQSGGHFPKPAVSPLRSCRRPKIYRTTNGGDEPRLAADNSIGCHEGDGKRGHDTSHGHNDAVEEISGKSALEHEAIVVQRGLPGWRQSVAHKESGLVLQAVDHDVVDRQDHDG